MCHRPRPAAGKEQVNGNYINSYTDPTGDHASLLLAEDPCDTGNVFTDRGLGRFGLDTDIRQG